MFDLLKKKLKESIGKISKAVKKEEIPIEKIEEAIEEVKEERIAEKKIEYKEELIKEAKLETKPIEKKLEKIYEVEEPKEGIIKRIKKKITEKEIGEEDIKDVLWDLKISLLESDVAVSVVDKILEDLKENLLGKSAKRGTIENIVKESLRNSISEVLDVDGFDLKERIGTKKPFLIIFLGFNGSGKTTTIARLGHLLKKQGFKVILAAADTWRAASIEQLEEHGKNLGINVIKQKYGSDPAAVIFDAVKHAKANDIDVVLADTAGRSHTNVNLMDELKKIIRVNKPDLKILVLDSLTGNDIYDQCRLFNEYVGVDGLILTKADVYEKGGAAISASHTIGKPILFLGVGQKYEDLQKFDAEKIVNSLL
jgi:fused signal recognition particle receptor